MIHEKKEHRGRPSEKPIEIVKQFVRTYDESVWYYDLDKSDKGPYLVELTDTTYDIAEKLFIKLERLQQPKFNENGRKIRTTKADQIKIETTERAYWREHYKLFPKDKPKERNRKSKKANVRRRTN